MNLLSNAADALEGEAGTVEVTTGASEEPATLAPCVWLEVTDTGTGMDQETQARIFEPFFSTKVSGRGLGLAAVRGIVGAHGGTLDVRSEPSLGTSFRLWFPVTEPARETTPDERERDPRLTRARDRHPPGSRLSPDAVRGMRAGGRSSTALAAAWTLPLVRIDLFFGCRGS